MKEHLTPDDIGKWNLILEKMKSAVNTTQYGNFVSHLRMASVDKSTGMISLSTNSPTILNVINQRYILLLKQAAAEVYGQPMEIEIIRQKNDQEPIIYREPDTAASIAVSGPAAYSEPFLNPNYTFRSFVVGSNNELAYAACNAVARGPATDKSNPLFIYGSSGLGKTHLISAIGNFILEKNSFIVPPKDSQTNWSTPFKIMKWTNFAKNTGIRTF